MEQRHTLLNRQLKKYFGNTENIPKELGTFIAAVNDAYCGFDSDRELLERSIDISSRELTQSVSLLSAALESTDDGILVVDLNGRVVGYNSKFIKMWNIPEDVVATKDDNKLLGCVMANLIDAESFLTKVRHLYSHPDEQSFDTIKFKDGRIIERFSAPQKIGGSTVGRVWSFRDVTIRKKAEDELKASKQMLQLVMDNIQQAIFWKDRNFAYLGCNIVFAKAAGLKKPEDVIGKTDYDLPWKKEESDFFRQCDKEIMESNKARAHILEPIQMANGKQAWIDVNKVPLHDIDGNVFGIIGTYEDVTERRRAESSLRESEERFKQITANAAEWIWEIDAKGLITYSSPVVEQLFGYKPEEIVGKKYIYDLFLSPKRKQLKEMVFRFIAAKQSFRGFVNPNLHKNGRIVWVATNGMPMLDSKGNLIGYRGSNIDITPQKQANEEIKKSHAILQQMINSMPFAVMVIGKDKVIRQANAAALHITGYKEEELIGHKCNKTLCPALENECPILDKGQTLDRSEKNAITKDQKTVPILKSAISIRLGEEDVLLEAFFDISQRRWVEEEMKKLNVQLEHTIEKLEITNCELSNFVNMASHDLREPLRKVSAFGMLLQKSLGNKISADEAENALVQLGFSKQQAKDALGRVPASVKDSEERIKLALKTLGK